MTGNDVSTADISEGQLLRLSMATMVAIDMQGISIPMSPSWPARTLDLAEVTMLARLSSGAHLLEELADSVAASTGSSADALRALGADLADRSMLVEGAADPEPFGSVEAEAPTRPIQPGVAHIVSVPTVLRIRGGGFEVRRHDGTLQLLLDPIELLVAASWRTPSTLDEAYARLVGDDPAITLERSAFQSISDRLHASGFLDPYDPDSPENGNHSAWTNEFRDSVARSMRIRQATKQAVARHAAEVAERPDAGPLVPVTPIHHNWVSPPLSLGLIVAYAKAHDDGILEKSYDFIPRWLIADDELEATCTRPGIFLFSNYIWNHGADLEYSARVKALSPTSITVHGGPDTPKYEADCERHFRDNPHVDITIRGEGEATFAEMLTALRGQVGDGPADLSCLADVAGLTFRLGDRLVTTPDRDRITDLDTIPSPFLTGLFDAYAAGPARAAMLETNRGCPYGCTFCDWGSATLSRIRKFDLDRVFAEIEWCARHDFQMVSLCDANFGIFERDVAVAEKFAEMKRTVGFPESVGNNYAKNTVKHLRKIIKEFADAGIVAEGIVSLQTMNDETLQVIRRKNIKVEKYNDLAAQFHANQLPLAVDLMMALPGSTTESWRSDLQECINRDVRSRVHPTTLLANSPMNEPSYREEHGIVALPGEVVKRTNTFDEDDWDQMWDLRHVFLLCDLFSVLRQVSRYVRQERGIKEVQFYERLMDDAFHDPDRWPTIAFTFRSVAFLMIPPCSWSLFIAEVGDYLKDVLGIPDDAALATVLAVQLAHLPSRDRQHFPETLELAHDFVAWHQMRLDSCDAGHREDWEQRMPALRELGPGSITIDDPDDICRTAIGSSVTLLSMRLQAWDFGSPVARPRIVLQGSDADAAPDPDDQRVAVEIGSAATAKAPVALGTAP